MSDNFLPDGYEVPETSGSFMKFQPGPNRFRFLAKPIMGAVFWEETEEGRRPVRARLGETLTIDPTKLKKDDRPKHFWASAVYNYNTKTIEILEITQKAVLRGIVLLAKNPKWGSPLGYDLIVTRKGEGFDTEYQVTPEPKEALDAPIAELWEGAKESLNLEALFSGGNPFDPVVQTAPENEINLDDMPL